MHVTNRQLDLSLLVPVCAWCKPKERGKGIGHLSHGICPWHLRKIKFELEGVVIERRQRTPIRRQRNENQLPLLSTPVGAHPKPN